MQQRQGGYTLLEIMLVLAIIGIMLAFAIPAYADYAVRTKVTECLALQAPARLKISEYVIDNKTMPDVADVTVNRATEYCDAGTFVRDSDDAGTLFINVNEGAIGAGDPGTVVEARLEARRCDNNDVEWSCFYASSGGDTTQGRYLPVSCRTTAVSFSESCAF